MTGFPYRRRKQTDITPYLPRSQSSKATWPDPAARNLLDFWTDPDPVRRPFVVWLLHRAVAQIKRRPVQDAHGTIDLAKYLQNSPIMNFWVEVAQPTQRSQASWTKQLAIHVFTTLAHLISRHGIISCVVDIVQAGRFVGQVWLGANIEGPVLLFLRWHTTLGESNRRAGLLPSSLFICRSVKGKLSVQRR